MAKQFKFDPWADHGHSEQIEEENADSTLKMSDQKCPSA